MRVGALPVRLFKCALDRVRDVGLVVRAVDVDAVPAGREEVVDAQAVRTRRLGEVARVPFGVADGGGGRGGAPRGGEAAEGDALEFLGVRGGGAVGGVAYYHAEALQRDKSEVVLDDIGTWSRPYRFECCDFGLLVVGGRVVDRHAASLALEKDVFHQWYAVVGTVAVAEEEHCRPVVGEVLAECAGCACCLF